MALYAKIKNQTVVRVIVADADFFDTFVDSEPGPWIETGEGIRANRANIGDHYDHENDVFYTQKPAASWQLNTSTWRWEPPVPAPADGEFYQWNETDQQWQLRQ